MAYYNRKELLYRTLMSIAGTKYKNFEVIVVDDGSLPEERIEDLVSIFSFLKVIRIDPLDKWYHNSCIPFNIGISKACGDIIMLQNPECIHLQDILTYMVERVNHSNYVTIATYSINKEMTEELPMRMKDKDFLNYFSSLPQRFVEDFVGWYNHRVYRPVYYHFCAALMKENMKILGGFDERFAEGIGYEDDDLVRRVERLKLDMIISDDVFVIHQWHPMVYDINDSEIEKLWIANAKLNWHIKKFERIVKVNNSYA